MLPPSWQPVLQAVRNGFEEVPLLGLAGASCFLFHLGTPLGLVKRRILFLLTMRVTMVDQLKNKEKLLQYFVAYALAWSAPT